MVHDIIETLRSLGKEERREKSQSNFPTSMEVLGVINPDARKVAKEVHAMVAGYSRERFLSLAVGLVDARILECQMVAWWLIEKRNGFAESMTIGEMKSIEGILDNWVSVDSYGTEIYGLLWRIGTLSDDDVFALTKSENLWYRRLALVATVHLNLASRGGTGDAPRTIRICEALVADREDLIEKAMSWALRSLIRWDRQAVEMFLEKHESTLRYRVKKEVIHKLVHGTKN